MPFCILVVDDHAPIRAMLRLTLIQHEYTVLEAATGPEALAVWRDGRPDALILDLNLPELPGWEVCRQIKAASSTPILVITGQVVTIEQMRQIAPEADGYLLKPFSVAELIAAVRAVLRASPSALA